MSKPTEGLTQEEEHKLVSNPEYALLGGIFNSLFLCPTLLHARTYFAVEENQTPDDDEIFQ